MPDQPPRSTFSLWMQAARPFSFTASITPVLLGSALAYNKQGFLRPLYFILAVLGGLLLHAGTNLISEYYDYKVGADTLTTFGSSRILVEGLMKPRQPLFGGFVAFTIAFLIGIFLVWKLGWVIVALGLTGLIGGYYYTANPLGYKYRALGEPLVFLLMGPLMVFGGYFVQTGRLSWLPIWVSLPVGMLVAAILHANNLRDIPDDSRAGFKTIPILTGWAFSTWSYRLLLAAAYLSVIVMVALKIAPWWTLLAMLTILPSLKLYQAVSKAEPLTPKTLATLDIATAQLHFQFGLALTIGFVLGRLVG